MTYFVLEVMPFLAYYVAPAFIAVTMLYNIAANK